MKQTLVTDVKNPDSNPVFPPNCFARGPPFWLRKITTDPHILADVNTGCPDGRCSKLQVCISELISDSYQYIPVMHVTTHCMI